MRTKPSIGKSDAERKPQQSDERSEVSAIPSSPSAIPGMGPIRYRALCKAGLRTFRDISQSSVETLAAIPGITEIKATSFLSYLAQFSADQIAAASEGNLDVSVKGPELNQWEAQSAPASVSALAIEAARALTGSVRLLTSPAGSELRHRLLASIDRFAVECQAVVIECVNPRSSETEKQLRRIRKVTEALIDMSKRTDPDRKEQARCADELSEITSWLSKARLEWAATKHA